MLSGLFKPLPKGEMQAVFGYALYVISWLAGAFHLTGLAFRRFSPQVSSLFQTKETLDYVSGAVLLALLVLPMLAAGLTAAFFIARMIFHPITGSISPLLRRKPQNRPLWGEEGPDLLASQPLLQVFSVEEMEQIAKHINVRAYQAGDVVVKQGEPGSEFFIIAEGEAVVEYERPSGAVEKVARLSFGDGFGEIALLQDCVRTATVRAAKPLSVLAMSKDSFNYMVNKADSGGKRFTSLLRRLQLLHGVKFMSGLSPSQLYRLASSSEEIWAAEGDTIISQGDQNADSFYIIKEGEVKAVIDGKEVGRLKQGDYFGEIALIANVPRTATIVATQKTTLLSITRAQFIELALSNVEFGSMLEMKARTRAQWKGVV